MSIPSIPSIADVYGAVRGSGDPPEAPEFTPLASDTSLASGTLLYSEGIAA